MLGNRFGTNKKFIRSAEFLASLNKFRPAGWVELSLIGSLLVCPFKNLIISWLAKGPDLFHIVDGQWIQMLAAVHQTLAYGFTET